MIISYEPQYFYFIFKHTLKIIKRKKTDDKIKKENQIIKNLSFLIKMITLLHNVGNKHTQSSNPHSINYNLKNLITAYSTERQFNKNNK